MADPYVEAVEAVEELQQLIERRGPDWSAIKAVASRLVNISATLGHQS